MQFTVLALPLVGVAAAQSTTVSGGATSTAALTPLQTCLNACAERNVNCRAQCVGVPYPDEAAANRTTACVAACPQGDGSQAETDRYARCQNACKTVRTTFLTYIEPSPGFSSYIPGLASTLMAAETGTSVPATGSGASASATGGSASRSFSSHTTPTDPDSLGLLFLHSSGLTLMCSQLLPLPPARLCHTPLLILRALRTLKLSLLSVRWPVSC